VEVLAIDFRVIGLIAAALNFIGADKVIGVPSRMIT
jgi:uncharacterized ferredoxin-like protein